MKKLTFREVIANIKEGEVWESNSKIIECGHSEITITNKCKQTNESISFGKTVMYKLQRKEYTFQEAFKAYEEGKIIESCITGDKCKLGLWCVRGNDKWNAPKDLGFTIDEIRGKWYIEEVE
ncbi:MAG: hypothetical protein ACRCVJ_11815 [Clostridium sp.]|uniref:hypothetical protein n=1 Tax=Clostridium sp. TaxID=1506 RepID=UPI003F36DE2A